MPNLEGEPTVPISFVTKKLHLDKPQLYRVIVDLEPPVRTTPNGRIYESELPRIEEAVSRYKQK